MRCGGGAARCRRVARARASAFGCEVAELQVEGRPRRRRRGPPTASDRADAVVFNGDVSALGARRRRGGATRRPRDRARGPFAVGDHLVPARTAGFPLDHHNVFFAEDYPRDSAASSRRARGRLADRVRLRAGSGRGGLRAQSRRARTAAGAGQRAAGRRPRSRCRLALRHGGATLSPCCCACGFGGSGTTVLASRRHSAGFGVAVPRRRVARCTDRSTPGPGELPPPGCAHSPPGLFLAEAWCILGPASRWPRCRGRLAARRRDVAARIGCAAHRLVPLAVPAHERRGRALRERRQVGTTWSRIFADDSTPGMPARVRARADQVQPLEVPRCDCAAGTRRSGTARGSSANAAPLTDSGARGSRLA